MVKNTVIGICGGSGSGKTSFIRKLRTIFSESEVCIISQDDYYRPRDEQKLDAKGIKNFDLPYSINDQDLIKDITLLKDGSSIQRMEYTFNNEKSVPAQITLHPAPVIIVEGLFVMHFEEIRSLFDYSLFIAAKENLKIIRRIKRDQIERNYPLDDVLYRYENHVMDSYEKYIGPYQNEVDIIINNNDSFDKGFEVFSGFVQGKINTSKVAN